jgi:hypothetical protein
MPSGSACATLRIALERVVAEGTVRRGVLRHDRGRQRPRIAEVDAERDARAGLGPVVVVVLDARAVVERDARHREDAGRADVVDVARLVLGPAHHADGGLVTDRQVHEALGHVAHVAFQRAARELDPRVEFTHLRLVGDDADGAGLGAGAVQRALRSRQHLDARHVVDLHVERALDGGDGLLVEVHAHRGQWARMVGVLAAGNAAHVGTCEAGTEALVGDVRQEFHVVAEIVDLEFGELFLADGLDGEGHILQAFVALLRRDHDSLESRFFRLLCLGDAGAGQHRARVGQSLSDCGRESEIIGSHDTPRIVMAGSV